MGSCSFHDSRYCRICDSSYCFFQKEQGRTGRKKQPETVSTDYERGLCDNGDMFCGNGNVVDNVLNTVIERLMVLVAVRRFFLK